MFDRIVSIDWSGANNDARAVNIRVVQATANTPEGEIVDPPRGRPRQRAWSRKCCRKWLAEALNRQAPRCLVALDFGFGLPWGTDKVVFGCKGWRETISAVAKLYKAEGVARGVAETVNGWDKFDGHGPYRLNENRTDSRFYLDNNVAYYRLVEVSIPQAISQWYVGSGAQVGLQTITGIAALEHLIGQRDAGAIDFEVWPQECWVPSGKKHLIVESYPSICPELEDYGPCVDKDQRDAWRVLRMIQNARRDGGLRPFFDIRPKPFGRIEGVQFEEQIRFEGWILGVG